MTEQPFDAQTSRLLQNHGFDPRTFESLRLRLREGRAGEETNRVSGAVAPPANGDITVLPAPGTSERRALGELGNAAIAAGEVGTVVLAGGMATRFGGVVKAAVEVVRGHSFLDVKLADVRTAATTAGGRIPVFLMTSFATQDEVDRLARAATTEAMPVETFSQLISIRLTPEGDVFLEDGQPSLYAPGHGDLVAALRRSSVLRRFRDEGGRVLFMSNVDNVAATLDPAVIGAHLRSGLDLTAELAPKEPGDRGGAPARVDGRVQIVESFRFPPGFDQDSIPIFNTNTFVLDAASIDRDFDFTWFAVRKTVEDRPAVQFERLVGELTAFLPSCFLSVDRDGEDGRFQPVKDPEELAKRREEIRKILEHRGVI